MTDLTSQWKKGELPSGWYYVRLIRGEYRIDLYINGKNEWIDCPDNIIDTVVFEVPSYEEYLSLTYAKEEDEKIIAEYEYENTQLKELLKEWVQFEIEENPNDFTVMSERMSELASKTKGIIK